MLGVFIDPVESMLDLNALFWLLVLGLFIYYSWRAFQAKDRAFAAARRHCKEMQVQMLDQTVYMRKLWIKRDSRGRPGLWRAFHFEFTVTGGDRYFGRVLMLGRHIQRVELEPHRLAE
ncbi:DUF3301 domain-containing protein [Marinimicrobium locisalis]|uniref:DUF3301 domain-containing protein n=1 Tax=Marinimicrobium locisalis TaxID=546022 RepID=UPI003221DC78